MSSNHFLETTGLRVKSTSPTRNLGFDLSSLEVFAIVCQTGSMTLAAQQLGLTQSAVSRLISTLEQRLGVALFERASRPLKPTSAGQKLAKAAERIIADAAEVPARLREASGGMLPELRLGLIDSLSDPMVPLLIKTLRDRVGTISVATGFLEPLRQRFLARELDAIIGCDPLDDLDGFDRHELLQEKFIVVAPRGEVPFSDAVSFRQFALGNPLIRSGAATRIAQRVDQQFRRMKLDVPNSFSCDTIESIMSLVAAGIGWSILTPLGVRKCINLVPAIQVLPFPSAGFSRHIYLVTRRGEIDPFASYLSSTCRKFLKRHYAPTLAAVAPWMSEAITVSDG